MEKELIITIKHKQTNINTFYGGLPNNCHLHQRKKQKHSKLQLQTNGKTQAFVKAF